MGKGEGTRQRIIELAAPLFNQRGYAGCSMGDVLEATGLAKGGVYRHFRGKEELAEEVFQYTLRRAMEARMPAEDASLPAGERLLGAIDRFVSTPSPVPGGCPILNTAVESDDGNAALRELARRGMGEWRARLEAVVREGVERGEIRAEVGARALANTVIATLEGALMMSRLEGSRAPLEDARGALAATVAGVMIRGKKRIRA